MEVGRFPFHRPWAVWLMGPSVGICHSHCYSLRDRWHLCAVLQATVLSGFREGGAQGEAVGITEIVAGACQLRKTQINDTPSPRHLVPARPSIGVRLAAEGEHSLYRLPQAFASGPALKAPLAHSQEAWGHGPSLWPCQPWAMALRVC